MLVVQVASPLEEGQSAWEDQPLEAEDLLVVQLLAAEVGPAQTALGFEQALVVVLVLEEGQDLPWDLLVELEAPQASEHCCDRFRELTGYRCFLASEGLVCSMTEVGLVEQVL